MTIFSDSVAYSELKILENHCSEIYCFFDGQRGGWGLKCTEIRENETKVKEFHSKFGLEEVVKKAAKYYLNLSEINQY